MGILTRRNIRKARGLYPRPPCNRREVFSCGGVLPRRAVVQHGRSAYSTDGRHTARGRMHPVPKKSKKGSNRFAGQGVRDENRAFVEFISKIRAACLFLHIANKKLIPMRIKFRTSRPMQTPRDISYTGNPTGGTTAYPAVLPAAILPTNRCSSRAARGSR